MRNEPWNQFEDFSVKMKLMHNFEKMVIFILGNFPQFPPAVTQALTEQKERILSHFSYP